MLFSALVDKQMLMKMMIFILKIAMELITIQLTTNYQDHIK